jgi:Cu+-exporting ATPase
VLKKSPPIFWWGFLFYIKIKNLPKKVVMVGDGVNDAPAMATATASFAVNNATDIAKHSASARLLGDSLSHAVSAVAISQATLRNIKQNLFFAFIYNCLGIPLAALGLLSPMIAAAAMALSSISVLMNALRLTRFKV